MVILRCHILNYTATTQQYCWHVPTDQGLLGALWATDPAMLKKYSILLSQSGGDKTGKDSCRLHSNDLKAGSGGTFRLKIWGDIMPQVKKDSGIHRFFWG